MRFSRKVGITSEPLLQKDTINIELRNKLWNISQKYINFFISKRDNYPYNPIQYINSSFIEPLAMYFWLDIDEISNRPENFKEYIKNNFFYKEWSNTYDFLEFLYSSIEPFGWNNKNIFYSSINNSLEEENSAYRMLDIWEFIEITNSEELDSINNAINNDYDAIRIHLTTASQYLKNPGADYRNSIKESISAVESICRIITDNPKATLWEALWKLKESWIIIHSALEEWYKKIYWYTSDEKWIRHSLIEWQDNITFDEAKYMLVSCSAFINYLISKSNI